MYNLNVIFLSNSLYIVLQTNNSVLLGIHTFASYFKVSWYSENNGFNDEIIIIKTFVYYVSII